LFCPEGYVLLMNCLVSRNIEQTWKKKIRTKALEILKQLMEQRKEESLEILLQNKTKFLQFLAEFLK